MTIEPRTTQVHDAPVLSLSLHDEAVVSCCQAHAWSHAACWDRALHLAASPLLRLRHRLEQVEEQLSRVVEVSGWVRGVFYEALILDPHLKSSSKQKEKSEIKTPSSSTVVQCKSDPFFMNPFCRKSWENSRKNS